MRRFSNTLISPKTWRPSGHMLTPREAIADPGIARNGWPSKMMSPPVTSTKPQIALRRVDLPAPLGPISATHSPAATSNETPCTASSWRTLQPGPEPAISASLLVSQVSLDHGGIGPDLGGRAFGNFFTKIENDDALADLHDQRHMVFDHHHAHIASWQSTDQCR